MTKLSSWQSLCHAIIVQAAEDYRTALKGDVIDGTDPEIILADVNRFFRSEYFDLMTNVNGEYLIENLTRAEE